MSAFDPLRTLPVSAIDLAWPSRHRGNCICESAHNHRPGNHRSRRWSMVERSTFEFFAKGTPRGYYVLAFVSWFAVVLTGLRFPYPAVAIAGRALTVAWGEDRRRYPAEKLEQR